VFLLQFALHARKILAVIEFMRERGEKKGRSTLAKIEILKMRKPPIYFQALFFHTIRNFPLSTHLPLLSLSHTIFANFHCYFPCGRKFSYFCLIPFICGAYFMLRNIHMYIYFSSVRFLIESVIEGWGQIYLGTLNVR